MANVTDTVRRIRNHPSLGLYCGRNEGDPPPGLESGIRAALAELHPDLHYIPNSAYGPVSGGGPYAAQTPRFYFKERATPKLHSELGMPDIVTLESLKQMMPERSQWPQSLDWGLHDFTLTGAQGLASFRAADRRGLRRGEGRGRVAAPRAVRELRRLPRDVRGPGRRTAWAPCSG